MGSIIQVALCQLFTFFHVMNANIFINDSWFPLFHWTFTFFFLRMWIFPPSLPLFFFWGKLESHCFRSPLSVLYLLCSLYETDPLCPFLSHYIWFLWTCLPWNWFSFLHYRFFPFCFISTLWYLIELFLLNLLPLCTWPNLIFFFFQ